LLGVGIRLRGRVRLTSQTTGLSEAEQAAALQRIEDEIKRQEAGVADGEKWVRLGDDKEPSDFQVAVNAHGEYEIWDANGRDIPNLRPALRVDAPGSPQALVKRLTHLTKYRNVRQIENTDPTSPLVGKITVELGILENHSDDSTFRPMPSTRPLAAGEPDGENGERFALRVTNLSGRPLNLAILDLEPDWCIEQVYPDPSSGKDSELLESGKPLIIKGYEKGLRATLPAGYQEGTDVLKVFVTDESTSFQWLTLPALDEPPPSGKRSIKNAGDPLEQLLSAFGAPNIPKTRKVVNMAAPKGKNWATAQVEIRARRPSIAHFPDPALSLFQSAVDEVVAKRNAAENTRSTRSVGNQTAQVARPELDDEIINSVAQFCLASARGELSTAELTALDKDTLEEARQRGAADTAKYCGGLAVGLAKEWFASRITGNTILYQQYEEALNKKFGGCDPKFAAALKQFAECLPWIGEIPYRQAANPNDAVIDGKLPAQATIGVVADWGTGEPEAIEVLRQVAGHNPHAAIHLGDIYYSGTEYEVENYFYQPWKNTLNLPASNILSLVVPGNHDLYAGGKAFYGLLDKLGQSHSFFCLRNADWQIIGLDTGLNDKLGGGPTKLADSEAKWLKDNIQAAKAVGRRTILMSHHQLFSANDKFAGKSYNEKLYNQLYDILPDVSLWLWGHEHDLVVFDKFCNLEKGRCIGGSAFPVGVFEMPTAPVNAAVPFNTQVALSKGFAFYQHCYTILRLDGKNATVSYYEDRDGGRLIFQETL
jgi:predicted phosphodiesterase